MRNNGLAVWVGLAVVAGFVFGAEARPAMTYRVIGPVVELSDTKIVVLKGQERWEIARDAETKVAGDVALGKEVTVEFRMSAAAIRGKDIVTPAPEAAPAAVGKPAEGAKSDAVVGEPKGSVKVVQPPAPPAK